MEYLEISDIKQRNIFHRLLVKFQCYIEKRKYNKNKEVSTDRFLGIKKERKSGTRRTN